MGFTRYWIRPAELEATQFAMFSEDCRAACKKIESCIFLARFYEKEVILDGFPPCEPFLIERVSGNAVRENRHRPNGIFEYCKTQRLLYDTAVEECLCLLKEYFPEVKVPKVKSPRVRTKQLMIPMQVLSFIGNFAPKAGCI